jgi:tRNA pseudouridine38-40 synthase
LNTRLPEDIRIMHSEECEPDFHPRYDAHDKLYEYRITRTKTMPPTKRLYSTHIYYPLDVQRMRQAASYLVGRHDFAAFCSAGSTVKDTVRTVLAVDVVEENEDLLIRVKGEGFLYNMVRIIAGTLLYVGQGKTEPTEVEDIIRKCDRSLAGKTLPAKGLTLEEVFI